MKEQENKDVITLNPVTAFKTTDGQLYENDIDALEHQKELNFESDIIEFSENYILYESSRDEFLRYVRENKDLLKEIFDRV